MGRERVGQAEVVADRGRRVKVGLLVSHPIQYFVPVYRELARTPGIDLTVIYRTRMGVEPYHDRGFDRVVKWDVPLTDGYRHCFLSEKKALDGFEAGIVGTVIRSRFDVLVVHGYDQLTNLVAILVAKLAGTRVVIRGDTRLQRHHLAAPAWKRVLKRMLFKVFDGFLTIGTLNREYYAHFGAKSERLFFAPFCVDNSAFALAGRDRERARRQCRTALGVSEDAVVVLFASKLIARKRAADLIQAFAELEQRRPCAWLVIAGAGDEEVALKALATSMDLQRVRFAGFQNQSALPSLYAASDVFVLPSEAEPWGLVLNEVMAAGLPVVVSDEVGAYPDLVARRGTGAVYPCGDLAALSSALDSLLQSEQKRCEMGRRAEALIGEWDVKACVSGIVSAVGRLT